MSTAASLVLSYGLNALWQVALWFAVATLAARLVRGRSLRLEHRIWSAALLASVLLPATAPGLRSAAASAWHMLLAPAPHGRVTVVLGTPLAVNAGAQHAVVPAQVWVGLAAMLALFSMAVAVRLGWSLHRTWRVAREAEPAVLTQEQENLVQQIVQRFELQQPRIATSPDVFGPVTIGMRHAAILLPEGWLATVAAEDVAAAIAHECAHIRRHDFARNLVLEVVALPIAWHPLLYLFRARLAESREMLCDAMAANALGSSHSYARSLLRLALDLASPNPRTLEAIGIFDSTNFERRIMQLTHRSLELRGLRRTAVLAGCCALATVACASAFALHLDGPALAKTSPADTTYTQLKTSDATLHQGYVAAAVPNNEPHAVAPAVVPASPRRAAPPQPVAAPAPAVAAEPQQAAAPPAQAATPWDTSHLVSTQPARLSGGVVESIILSRVEPEYPPIARAAKVEGDVVLHVLIGEDGAPKAIQALSGPEMLKGAALAAVKEWRFRPYLLNGQPTAVDTMLTVNFDLSK